MKKISIPFLITATLLFTLSSCLKDKGFENNEYGINNIESQPPGVGFPLSTKTQAVGLDVSSSTQSVSNMVYVNLESVTPAKSAVSVTIQDNTAAQVAAYNTANGLTGSNAILVMPSSLYNVATSIQIPAGGRNAQTPINVTNTTTLDPTRTYAVGFRITGVDGGYRIAENLKDLFIIISLKNRMDGIYRITGAALRAGDPVLTGSFFYLATLATSGANSVQWVGPVYWGGQLSQLPGGYEPNITVDPSTNSITSVTSSTGIYMTSPIVRTDIVGTSHRYDPVTKTLYFEFSYGGGPSSRLFSIQAQYLRPR